MVEFWGGRLVGVEYHISKLTPLPQSQKYVVIVMDFKYFTWNLSLFLDLICHASTKKPWCICQLITSKSTPLSSLPPPPPPPRTTHSTAVFSCLHSTSGEHFYVNVAANRLDGILATKSGFGINISITGIPLLTVN